jgi:hypothetical protein
LRPAQPGSSAYPETPAGSALAGWLVTGSRWRLAEGKHGGDQLVQRPGQVVSGDQGNLLTGAEMVNRTAGYRAIGRRGSQGAR